MLPVVAVFGVLVILIGIYLARVPAYNAEDFMALQKSSFAPFLKDLAFRWHAGQVMLDLVLITVCYYAAYRLRFEGDELAQFPSVLHRIAAGGARCASWRRSTARGCTSVRGRRSAFATSTAVARAVGMGSLLYAWRSRTTSIAAEGFVARRVRPRRAAA